MKALSCFGAVLLLALLAGGCPSDEGAKWSTVLDGDDLNRVVLSAYGSSASDVYAVGGGLGNGVGALVAHYDGSVWSEIDTGSPETFWWTFGLGADNVYFVGEQGTIFHRQGGQVTQMTTPTTETIFGIWGAAPDDLWAVGGEPTADPPTTVVLHYDGNEWTDATPPAATGGALFKVWGTSASDIYACGQMGVILHYNGSTWEAEESGSTVSLFTVHGGGGEVYAVGGPSATVLQRVGGAWQNVDTGFPASILNGVSVSESGEVLVVGMNGVKLRFSDGEWSDETIEPPGFDLHAVWSDFGQTYVVGGNFFAPGTPQTVRIGIVGYFGTETPPDQIGQ